VAHLDQLSSVLVHFGLGRLSAVTTVNCDLDSGEVMECATYEYYECYQEGRTPT
jgi:hypothetical protein